MRTLRILPHLRSSVVEELPSDQVVLFTSRRDDSDVVVPADGPTVVPLRWSALRQAARDPDLELVEVAEPLWPGEWLRAIRYVAVVRVLRAVRPGRDRARVATYAIENLDARVRLSPPALDGRPFLGAIASALAVLGVGVSMLLVDTVAFGTTGAYENYRRAFGWALRRTRHAVLPPRIGVCSVCGPPDSDRSARTATVLFLGAPSERKGFADLMAAWELAGMVERGWRLVVADPSGQGTRDVPPGVSVRSDVPRSAVHELLRTSAAVAMPSVGLPRWREQIGLPLVEGLAHGCDVVTTTETGLADDLRAHPLVTFTTPRAPESLARGLRGLAERRCRRPDDDTSSWARAGYSKADVMRWWLGEDASAP